MAGLTRKAVAENIWRGIGMGKGGDGHKKIAETKGSFSDLLIGLVTPEGLEPSTQ